MATDPKNEDLAARILSLEKVYYTSRALVVSAIFLVAIFFGHTYIFQIPDAIEGKINSHIDEGTGKTLEEFINDVKSITASQLHIQSGTAIAHHDDYSSLRQRNANGERGAINVRVDFDKPFLEIPEVMVSLSLIDHVTDSGQNNLRINVKVTNRDRHGFNYSIVTWANTDIWRADLSWIAYGRSRRDGNSSDPQAGALQSN